MTTVEFNYKLTGMQKHLEYFAKKLTNNDDDAQDLLQETFLKALIFRDKFVESTNLKAWLFTIMKNIFINNYRKKTKANTIIDSTDNLYYINSGSTVIQNKAESNIMMDELEMMIEKLDDSLKVPFEMHYLGYKYQEIADKLRLPLGTVKSRIFFARKALKGMIGARYGSLSMAR